MLLGALTRLPEAGRIRALHVDHQLNPSSAEWARHCARTCAALGVPFVDLRVIVDAQSGIGMEAAARRARYAALAESLAHDETLLTAHHADDQLETLLLRLLRGTGVRGLRGVLPVVRLGGGRVARPMLRFTRAEIEAVAERWGLEWLEDPSNRSLDFDRNLIRSRLAPILRERWGDSAAYRASRLADAMRDAESILDDVARRDLAEAGAEPGRVPLGNLRGLGDARQRNLLRHAIRDAGLPMADARRLEALRRAIGATSADAVRRIEWRGAEARVHRDRLYLLARPSTPTLGPVGAAESDSAPAVAVSDPETPPPDTPVAICGRVSASEPWRGPEGCVVLEPITVSASKPAVERAHDEVGVFSDVLGVPPDAVVRRCETPAVIGLPESWAREGLDVRFRQGGERFKPAGRAHRRTLKAWLRENGVVPWMRDRIPLLYRDGRLVAIADLTIDDDARRTCPDEARWRVRWLDHPRID